MRISKPLKKEAQKYGFSDMFYTPSNEEQLNERIETFTKGGDAGTFTILGIVLNYMSILLARKDREIAELDKMVNELKEREQSAIQAEVEAAEAEAGWDPTP